jgi:(p)ppGpp synthase/HD superfamily hydrolase
MAASYAKAIHEKQKRHGGGPYIYHPMRVAGRVSLLDGATEEMVAAAWLHDVLEDTTHPIVQVQADIEIEFSPKVLKLVIELTNVSKGLSLPREQRKRLDREHAAKTSVEARRIKMLDRIDNLRDMNLADEAFRSLYCAESRLLAEAIGDADRELKKELLELIGRIILNKLF